MMRKIKKILLFIFFMIFIHNDSLHALNVATHKAINVAISEGTYNGFSLDLYLKNNLGLLSGVKEILTKNNNVQRWLELGGEYEDVPTWYQMYLRSVNHFHNPITDQGFSGLWGIGTLSGMSSTQWALLPLSTQSPGGYYSWNDVRDYYYKALTSNAKTERDTNFAQTFRGVGQLMHLIQDISVPAHTRDDEHFFYNYETWVDNVRGVDPGWFQNLLSTPNFFAGTINNVASVIDTNQYNGTNPQVTLSNIAGISEYTNANYFSDETIPNNDPTPLHIFPYPQVNNVNAQICEDYALGSTDKRRYISRKDKGSCPPATEARVADHFAAVSLLAAENMIISENISTIRLWLDDNVHNTYAKELLPRAVGYSAGLLNYFFRGTLEITAPDTYVYSIIDGSVSPQQFTKIKAKVRNTTPNEQIQAGTLTAVAKYKKRTDYAPDLSTEPPTLASREAEFSYSVSAQWTLSSTEISSINTAPVEFTFNFENSPIPAGITDLYLFIIFKGTLGNEVDNAVAIGMKDIIEPTHHVIWNLTDMVILYYQEANDPEPRYHLYTADEIRGRPELLNIINQNNIWDAYLDPHDITIRIAYLNNPPDPNNFIHINPIAEAVLPGGRHMRLIILLDRENNNYMRITSFDSVYDNNQRSFLPWGCLRTDTLVGAGDDIYNGQYMGKYCDSTFSSLGYQERDGVFRYQEASVFRAFKQHLRSLGKLWISRIPLPDERYYPDEEAIPAQKAPEKATINFP